ncbi:hypothetical protein [Haloferula rosea]|uniref:Uncharacterized protein n=1 Tax=Haloferula rosea TaxID=490093 RepID=A0A934VH86_9BACT|nr:hypothetical protein [Haloferula rosea]MBK1828812.1 hypothetical protein [Haloferula rosea]
MNVTKVCCQGCGADLEVDEGIRFVTCNYCHSRLEIVHDKSVTHSKLLEKLEKKTGEMADDLKIIRLQNELEKLDREWAMRSEDFMVSNKHGVKSVPSSAGSMVGGMVAVVFGIFWMVMASSMGAPGIFPLFGLLFIVVAVVGMVRGADKAEQYRTGKRAYDAQRQKLLLQIDDVRQGP